MLVVVISWTGHAYVYGPFDNAAEAEIWAEKYLPQTEKHVGSGDPRSKWQTCHDYGKGKP